MKAVLMSIQPKWVEKIVSGEKTIEVRKTVPKLETPFKCFIYCSKGARFNHKENKDMRQHWIRLALEHTQGKVIGEFICDKIDEKWFYISTDGVPITNIERDFETLSCLKRKDIINYALQPNKALKVHNGTMFIYGLHISDLKIYDKPKGVNEFYQPCSQSKNLNCDWLRKHNICACSNKRFLTRPPQSWCYVEVIG